MTFSTSHATMLTAAAVTAAAISIIFYSKAVSSSEKKESKVECASTKPARNGVNSGIQDLIGNTPMILIKSLSKMTGCDIYGKAEFLNVAGSTKDRVALAIIQDAEERGLIAPNTGCTIFEGTVGSTGISLATIARAKGYHCHIIMPDDVAVEKSDLLETLGATVEKVRPCSIVDPNHFVNMAEKRANEMNEQAKETGSLARGYFCRQFENLANFDCHYRTTGPEIFAQMNGDIDAFIMGAGTGGTIAGVARYLKPRLPNIQIVLADPQGSGLLNKVKYQTLYSSKDAEGTRKRHQIDTIVEGIGLARLTANFSKGLDVIDDAIRVTDQECVDMARFLLDQEGLFVGSSTACHCVAAVKTAKLLGPGHRIATILCDSGARHLSKLYNSNFLGKSGLESRKDPTLAISGL